MDFSNFSNLHRLKSGILGRVQDLPRSIAKKSKFIANSVPWKIRKKIIGIGFLAIAVILGMWANEIAKNEAILAWEKTHLPPVQIFGFAMGSRGLREEKEVRQLQQISRFLPSSLDEAGSIWMSEDLNWVAFYSTHNEMTQTKVYCLICSEIPKKWHPLGLGWKGLELTIDAIDRHLSQIKKSTPQKKILSKKDPREISY